MIARQPPFVPDRYARVEYAVLFHPCRCGHCHIEFRACGLLPRTTPPSQRKEPGKLSPQRSTIEYR